MKCALAARLLLFLTLLLAPACLTGGGGGGGGAAGGGTSDGGVIATYRYYVATSGNDINSGTAQSPFRTIQKAVDVAQAGDRVLVRAGLYRERVRFPHSGALGRPISLHGERGPGGERLTIVDGSERTSGWVPAPERGAGVFKTSSIPYEPLCMTLGDRDIPRIARLDQRDPFDSTILYGDFLGYPPDKRVQHDIRHQSVLFWDGIEALFGFKDGVTYLRFRNGEDPSQRDVRSAPAGAGFLIDKQSHISISGFLIRGAQIGVRVTGIEATNNRVEDNSLMNGQLRIDIGNGASRTEVVGNVMRMNMLGTFRPGAWGGLLMLSGDASNYDLAVKEHIYRTYKYGISGIMVSCTDDSGIMIVGAGNGNQIRGNEITETLCGITMDDVADLTISGNTIHAISSAAMYAEHSNVINAQIFDNLIYDCLHGIRLQRAKAPLALHYYRNKYWSPRQTGDCGFFYHMPTEPVVTSPAKLMFYHNTCAGSFIGFYFAPDLKNFGGLQGAYFLNNVISAQDPLSSGPGAVGGFDYNWLGGNGRYANTLPWGSHNVVQAGTYQWNSSAVMPDFRLPMGSAARAAGLDLSGNVTLGGKVIGPLPGMAGGYFTGAKPNMGAVP